MCITTTYKTNMYDFFLVTLLVIDDFGEGLPVSWIITNHEDGVVLSYWLKAISERRGPIHPKRLMSDDAEQFYNAWVSVFGGKDLNKLLCAWHVDKAWRKALNENVAELQDRIEIYHYLRVLLIEVEEPKFRVALQQLLTILEEKSTEFHTYFTKYYAKRQEQWASCYRISTTVNTNMFVESFHRLLKIVYLQHKQNRRIDYLLNVLKTGKG